jgi:hypothetical protein
MGLSRMNTVICNGRCLDDGNDKGSGSRDSSAMDCSCSSQNMRSCQEIIVQSHDVEERFRV